MKTSPQLSTASAMVVGQSAVTAPCPVVAIVKSPLKQLKKLRKQELRRFFISWCEGLHALGFSF